MNSFYCARCADETSTVGSHDTGNEFHFNSDDQMTDLVLNFVDKVRDENGVNTTHKNSLHTRFYQTVQIQIAVLEEVHRETRQVTPMPKPLLPRFVTISELFEHLRNRLLFVRIYYRMEEMSFLLDKILYYLQKEL